MSSHDRCGKIWNSPHLACVWCRKRRHICKIYAIFLKKISFVKNELCREIRFVVIYALLCGEKFVQKFSMWRKNDKYEVWSNCQFYLYFFMLFTRGQTGQIIFFTFVDIFYKRSERPCWQFYRYLLVLANIF